MKKFAVGDPLAGFLIKKLGFTPLRTALFIVIVALIYDGLQILVLDKIYLYQDFLQIMTVFVWHYIFVPIMGYFYIWSYWSLANLLNSLAKGNAVQLSKQEINAYLQSTNKSWRFYLSILGGIVLGSLFFIRSILYQTYLDSSPLFIIPRQISWFVAGYMVSMLSIILILNVFIIHKTFKDNAVSFNPVHPDKSGGFGALGNYSKTIAYLISATGLAIGLTELRYYLGLFPQELWIIHLSIPLYIAGATASFFAPLLTAHKRMKGEKTKALLEIQSHISKVYSESKEKIIQKNEDIEEGLTQIKQLQSLDEITGKASEWPLNMSALRGYLLSITSPIISIGFALLGDYISGLVSFHA